MANDFISSLLGGGNTPSLNDITNGQINPNTQQSGVQQLLQPAPDSQTQPQPQSQQNPRPILPSEHRFVEHDPKHTGAAGIARDIFGTLGDFLLTRLGMPAMYAPAQQQRKLEEARQGFDQDPLAAIDRVSSLNFKEGDNLRNHYIEQQRLAATQASTQEARDARIASLKVANEDRVRNRAAAYLNGLAAVSPDKMDAAYTQARKNAISLASQQGVDLTKELPEKFDRNALTSFISSSVPAAKQWDQSLTKEKIVNKKVNDEERLKLLRMGQAERMSYLQNTLGIANAREARMAGFTQAQIDRIYGRNGTVQEGTKPVRLPPGQTSVNPQPSSSSQAPPVGYKNKHGLTFKGGDPNNRNNWK